MAGRNVKRGLLYYRMDCDILGDRKIKRLIRRWSSDGLAVYLALLCEVYRDKGYYLEMDGDLLADIADAFDMDEKKAVGICKECIDLGLFDRELLTLKNVLSSRGVQRRYLDIMAALRRKAGIDSELLLISAEEMRKDSGKTGSDGEEMLQDSESLRRNGNDSEPLQQNEETMRRLEEEKAISSDSSIEKEKEVKDSKDKNIDIHTGFERKGVQGETTASGGASAPMPEPPENERDKLAQDAFGRAWSVLERHERMYLWAARYYPLLFQFERPLTVENCRSIVSRIADWKDIDRIMENISNRKNILAEKSSAIATFNAFARMDTILQRKQRIR